MQRATTEHFRTYREPTPRPRLQAGDESESPRFHLPVGKTTGSTKGPSGASASSSSVGGTTAKAAPRAGKATPRAGKAAAPAAGQAAVLAERLNLLVLPSSREQQDLEHIEYILKHVMLRLLCSFSNQWLDFTLGALLISTVVVPVLQRGRQASGVCTHPHNGGFLDRHRWHCCCRVCEPIWSHVMKSPIMLSKCFLHAKTHRSCWPDPRQLFRATCWWYVLTVACHVLRVAFSV